LSQVFGSAEAAQPLLASLSEAGRAEGIHFRFDRIPVVPNTLDAHRLVLLAEQEARSEDVVEGIFRAFFEEGRDIGDRGVLAEIAASAGMTPSLVQAELDGDSIRNEVLVRQARIRRSGLTGVPGLIVNGTVAVLGAQEPETIVAAIDQALFPALQGEDGPVTVH
jgi:predicted DsbA family dithiol-disulfide isomerase